LRNFNTKSNKPNNLCGAVPKSLVYVFHFSKSNFFGTAPQEIEDLRNISKALAESPI
jgi:hypothetical protein